MKNLIKFILLIIYTVFIFFINSYKLLGIVAFINISLAILLKLNIKEMLKNLAKIFIFIVFTIIVNSLIESLNYAMVIAIKLVLICNITYIFSRTISYMEFADVIEKLFYPLKIFKTNPKEISLIVIIALSFVPILKDELFQIKNVLNVKGIKNTKINLIKNMNLIFKPFFISILQRVNEIELSLKSKNYQN